MNRMIDCLFNRSVLCTSRLSYPLFQLIRNPCSSASNVAQAVSFKLLVFQLILSYSYYFISVTVTNQLQLLVFQLFSVTVTGISVIFSYSYTKIQRIRREICNFLNKNCCKNFEKKQLINTIANIKDKMPQLLLLCLSTIISNKPAECQSVIEGFQRHIE